MHVHVHVHIHIHIRIYIYTHVNANVHVKCLEICVDKHAQLPRHQYEYGHVHMCVSTLYTWLLVHLYIHIYIYMCVCIDWLSVFRPLCCYCFLFGYFNSVGACGQDQPLTAERTAKRKAQEEDAPLGRQLLWVTVNLGFRMAWQVIINLFLHIQSYCSLQNLTFVT